MRKSFFLKKPAPGKPLALKGMADGLNGMDRALTQMKVHGGRVVWSPDGIPTIVPYGTSETENATGSLDVYEWNTTLSGTTVTATGGPIKYAGAKIPTSGTTITRTCDISGITDGQTWCLYLAIDLGASTVTLNIAATRPVDDPANGIINHWLSLWKRDGSVYTRTLILHRGAIQFSGIWNQ